MSTEQRIHEMRDLLESILNRLSDQERYESIPVDVRGREWWGEREACERKGVSHSVLRRPENRRYLPNHGISAEVVSAGRYSKMYHWSWVAEWLPLTEADIDQILRRGDWAGRETAGQ